MWPLGDRRFPFSSRAKNISLVRCSHFWNICEHLRSCNILYLSSCFFYSISARYWNDVWGIALRPKMKIVNTRMKHVDREIDLVSLNPDGMIILCYTYTMVNWWILILKIGWAWYIRAQNTDNWLFTLVTSNAVPWRFKIYYYCRSTFKLTTAFN